MKHKAAFVGFRHGHVESLYKLMKEDPEMEIVALCEENPEAAASVEKSGRTITHTDFSKMLEKVDFDILCIGDYYGIRGERVIAGLKAGKHVISDKPLCT
ncbi:MAG: Gfo/Idh/MocA family oxidoreductase, partial [Lentisphaeria bacterium]|nr:Gfo/Idh/MocA family oxidoreductase [Lentisphaeria bacterium]